jgi:hypothetical protein
VAVDFVPSSGVQEHYVLSTREGRESRSLPSQILDPKVLFLLDYRDAESLSIGNQFRPIDLAAGHHLEIRSNAGPDCPARVPACPNSWAKFVFKYSSQLLIPQVQRRSTPILPACWQYRGAAVRLLLRLSGRSTSSTPIKSSSRRNQNDGNLFLHLAPISNKRRLN